MHLQGGQKLMKTNIAIIAYRETSFPISNFYQVFNVYLLVSKWTDHAISPLAAVFTTISIEIGALPFHLA